MSNYILGASLIAAALAVLLVVGVRPRGRWRLVLSPFRIKPERMTVARLGLTVRECSNVRRVDSILAGFLSGFNQTLTARSLEEAFAACDRESPLLRPFAHEGLAMGYTPRALFRYDAGSFERDVVKKKPEFRYLYYVGLGFWSGIRNHPARKVMGIVPGLDPLHRYLVFDGYGFKVAFFDAPRSKSALTRLHAFDGYARHAAWQGVGRALYFRFMDDADVMFDHIRACGDHAADAAAGVGLAAVFVNPDRIDRAIELARMMPPEWQPHVHLGMCFGFKARSINDVDQFERDLARLEPGVQAAIWASIRECDRVELLVRSELSDQGYQDWRERVTAWMDERIEYPMRGVRPLPARAPLGGCGVGESRTVGVGELRKGVAG